MTSIIGTAGRPPTRAAAARAAGRAAGRVAGRAAALLRRVPPAIRAAPFTTALLGVLLVVGPATVLLTGDAADAVGYGLPALEAGQWWRFGIGAVVLPEPVMYLVMAPLIVVAVGYYERRVGAGRAAVVLLTTHLTGTVGTALLLAGTRHWDWDWAAMAAAHTDLGMSAGTVGVLAAATCVMPPALRRRVRWVAGGYLAVMVLRSGLLWDAEHTIGWLAGLALGAVIVPADGHREAAVPSDGRGAVGGHRMSGPRRLAAASRVLGVRAGMAWAMVVLAASRLVLALYPGTGGLFGDGVAQPTVIHSDVLVAAGVSGLVALVIANALRRGLPMAWWAAAGFAGLAILRTAPSAEPVDRVTVLLWGLFAGALLTARGYWPWRLPTAALRRGLRRLLIAAGAFVAGTAVLLWLFRDQLPGEVPGARRILARALFDDQTGAAPAAHLLLTAATWVWAIALLLVLIPLLYATPLPRLRDPAHRDSADRDLEPPRERLMALMRRYGGGTLGWQRTWPGCSVWSGDGSQVAVAYRVVNGVAIAIGNPVGPRDRWPAAIQDFRAMCVRRGWTTAWYAVDEHFPAVDGGWRRTSIGEDAVIELPALAFTGKSWQDVRTARNRAERDRIRCTEVDLAKADLATLAGIHDVCSAWAQGKPLPEMGFTLGTIAHAQDGSTRTFVAAGDDGVVHGVTTWLPVHADGRVVGWTLDVMRRRSDGFRPVMEFLIAECLLTFQREGYDLASLSVAPLARAAADSGAGGGADLLGRTLDRLGELLEPVYGFRSLLAYKRKFHPRFRPVYLAYGSPADLAEIAVAIGHAYLPDLSAAQALSVARLLRPGRRSAAVAGVVSR